MSFDSAVYLERRREMEEFVRDTRRKMLAEFEITCDRYDFDRTYSGLAHQEHMRLHSLMDRMRDDVVPKAVITLFGLLYGGLPWIPVIDWLVQRNEVKNFAHHILKVIPAIPFTMPELDEFARGQEWCDAWTDFRRDMVLARITNLIEEITK